MLRQTSRPASECCAASGDVTCLAEVKPALTCAPANGKPACHNVLTEGMPAPVGLGLADTMPLFAASFGGR